MAELGKGMELGEEYKANRPMPELGEDKADQETGARCELDQKTVEAPEANGGQIGQEAKGVPVDVSLLIEPSGATMDQQTEVEQRERETGGRVGVDKSAEEEEREVACRRCGDSGLWGEDSRGRGPRDSG